LEIWDQRKKKKTNITVIYFPSIQKKNDFLFDVFAAENEIFSVLVP